MKRSLRVLLATCLVAGLAGSTGPARAHGAIDDSSPVGGSTVPEPPKRVTLDLAEPPADGSAIAVTDACEDKVSGRAVIDGDRLTVPITDGRPGRWIVRLRSISAVDGHLVKANFQFRVSGKTDCSAEESPDASETTNEDDDVELADPPPPLQNDETSFPIVPFALGTVVLIAVAVALRRSGTKR